MSLFLCGYALFSLLNSYHSICPTTWSGRGPLTFLWARLLPELGRAQNTKIASEENTDSKVNNNSALLRCILQCPKQEGTDGEAQHFPRPVGLAELLVQLDEQPRAAFAQQLLNLCKSCFRCRGLGIAFIFFLQMEAKRLVCCMLCLCMMEG